MDILLYSTKLGNIVSDRMFGVKLPRDNGPDYLSAYTAPLDVIGASSIRFSYDVDVGPYALGSDEFSTAETLVFAADRGIPVNLIINTKGLFLPDQDNNPYTPRELDLAKIATVKSFIIDLLSTSGSRDPALADAIIQTIELGNEYWGLGEQTSLEYGRLVNVLARVVQEAIDEVASRNEGATGPEPKILVQMGSPYSIEFDGATTASPYFGYTWDEMVAQANIDIMSQIRNPFSVAAIDGLVEHYYYTRTSDDFFFTSTSQRFIDVDIRQWQQNGFADKEIYITEWNNKLNNPSQFGLKGAGVIVEMFEDMVRLGIDGANIWPLQHNSTRLLDTLGRFEDGSFRVTPRGALFSMMSDALVGARHIESNISTSNGYDYELNAYSTKDSFVFYISSRSEDPLNINLDLSHIVSGYKSVSAVQVGYDPMTADGFYFYNGFNFLTDFYQDPDALAKVTQLHNLSSPNDLHFSLGAYEVVQLVYSLAPGRDISGRAIAEILIGAGGNDVVMGRGGDDMILGRLSDDALYGNLGRDILRGGAGNDRLFGGVGADKLNGQGGADLLTGGGGRDTFIFNSSLDVKNVDMIADFDLAADKIWLDNAVYRSIGLGGLDARAFTANSLGTATDSFDRILYERGTGRLYYDSDGTGSAVKQHFATLAANIDLVADNFFVF